MVDALWETVFKAATANLDDDAPMVMLAAATRYLLAPPEKDDLVGQYPMVVRTRMRRLARGEGGQLWNEFNWIELMPEIKGIAKIDEEAVKAIISRGLAAKAPARTFRKLTSVPFLPPTLQVAEIIKKKCNTNPTHRRKTRGGDPLGQSSRVAKNGHLPARPRAHFDLLRLVLAQVRP